MESDRLKKCMLSLSYFLFGALWLLVGITTYLYPRYPFSRLFDYLWLAIYAVPLMLFTALLYTYADLEKPRNSSFKGVSKMLFASILVMFLSMIASFMSDFGAVLPRALRWFAIFLVIFTIAIQKIKHNKKLKMGLLEMTGEYMGIAFVTVYFFVMLWSYMGLGNGLLSFIDGILGFFFGLFLSLKEHN